MSRIYEGSYDLKYYLDRQPADLSGKSNSHLLKGRVLVFVQYRQKGKPALSDLIVTEKQGQSY